MKVLEISNANVKLQGQNDDRQMLLNASLFDDMLVRSFKLDNNVYREKLAKMIVRHKLTFLLVEYEGIRDVHTYLYPNVKQITRTTFKADRFKLNLRNKSRVNRC